MNTEIKELTYKYSKEELATMYVGVVRNHPISDFYRWVANKTNIESGATRFHCSNPILRDIGVEQLRLLIRLLEEYLYDIGGNG